MSIGIVDKKGNLSRGFSDSYTPSKYMHEILQGAIERRDDLDVKIKKIEEAIQKADTEKELKILKNSLKMANISRDNIARKINKKVNVDRFKEQRLVEEFGEEAIRRAFKLAKKDRDEMINMLESNGLFDCLKEEEEGS